VPSAKSDIIPVMVNRTKTALISVYDKNGIEDFAKSLVDLGWKIISSGGTAKYLSDAGVETTDLADITEFPAILSHRVVTLHPKIHGGLLALNTPEHLVELEKYGIPWIDLVCSDLYPLEDEINKIDSTKESVIAQTDMGGIALIRSSSKGRRITICDRADRAGVISWLQNGEHDKEKFIDDLASKAEAVVARYCAASAGYHSGGVYESIFGKKVLECAYGENAYQKPASLYRNHKTKGDPLSVHSWAQIAGSPTSYNNICDIDRMMQTMTHIGAGYEKNMGQVPCVAIGVKHGNACGAGLCHAEASYGLAKAGVDSRIQAVEKMLQGDLRAIFGGSVMLNFRVDAGVADELVHKFCDKGRRLLDVICAPAFSDEAVEILSRKKGKCRLMANPNIEKAGLDSLDTATRLRYVRGGFLEQPNYDFVPDMSRFNLGDEQFADTVLAWAVGATSNSNTITITKDGRLVGNGVGQQDRVGAAKLAIFRADEAVKFKAEQEKNSADGRFRSQGGGKSHNSSPVLFLEKADLQNAVAYSDSFFPFPDAVEVLIERGIKTIFSTSGSVNDDKTMDLCKAKDVKLILLLDKEARGFYQH
jgi:phosphoribosylaminoimidazolecarboxamide formyltransferase / IMP cyclohydrolase